MSHTDLHEYIGKDLEAMSVAQNYRYWILSEFHRYLGKTVAEVGAGIGAFSQLLLKTSIDSLSAFEPSQNMFAMLQTRLYDDHRAQAINGFFGKQQTDQVFDSVLYINVLEHVKFDALEIGRVYDLLNPNGHLLIFVPALPWLYSPFDAQIGHFRRYLKNDLVNIVKRSGFEIVKARYFDVAGVLPWYINFVLLQNTMSGSSVSLYDRWVVPPMRVLESIITPPLGKNILLVARKLES